MRDLLETARTHRSRLVSLMTGRTVRESATLAAIAAEVTAGSLSAITAASFGLYSNATGDDSVAITSGLKVLTSTNNPWTAADVGKAIDVAGAGSAGGTLSTRILAYTNPGSVTLALAASATVTPTATSAAGLAVWGSDHLATKTLPADTNAAGTQETPDLSLSAVASGTYASRSMAARLAEVFNVKDFGAVGDGVTNDTVAVQAAITAAGVAGGAVYVPPGTFFVDSLTMTSLTNVTLRGDGTMSTLKLNTAPTQNIQNVTTWLLIDTCSNCAVENLHFNLNNKEHTAVGVKGCTDVRVERNYIHNSPGTIGDNRPAIVIHSTAGARVISNYVYDVSAWFYFGMSTTLGQITDSVMVGNVFRNSKSTNAANCTRSTIAGNVFDTSLYAGIELGGVGTAMFDWSITGNTFKGCSAPALQVSALSAGGLTRDGVITGNVFTGGLDAALYCFGDVWDVTIANNLIRDNAKGIVLTVSAAGGCQRFSISGNRIYDTRSAGARTQVYGIELALATSGGGAISGEALRDIQITDNKIDNHTDSGIVFTYTSGTAVGARITLGGNHIRGSSSLGNIAIGTAYAGGWVDVIVERNLLSNATVQDFRISINSGDVNRWFFRDNTTLSATTYTFIAGVPALHGLRGAGTPAAVIVAGIGSTYINTTGGASTTTYVKESGTTSAGWVAK